MQVIVEVLATLMDVVFMVWFVSKMLQISVKEHPLSLVWAILLLVYQLIADNILSGFELIYEIGVITFSIGFAFSLTKRKFWWPVFSVCSYIVILMLANSLVFSIFSSWIEGFVEYLPGFSLKLRFIYILVCKITQFAFFRLVLQLFKRDQYLDIFYGILSFVFTSATALGLGIIMKMAVNKEFSDNDFLIMILVGILLLVNIILFIMIYQVQKLLKSKFILSLIQERIKSEEARVEDARAIWEKIRKIKHDLRNHFTVMKGYLDDGLVHQCREYLSELNNSVENIGNLIQSGNTVIDYLINSKLCNITDVQILVSGYVGDFSDITDTDLACILGNIIDNAIEAQKLVNEDKRIELFFGCKNNNRIIICKNAIADSVLHNNKKMFSTKNEPSLHGLGHLIVEGTVQKYNGLVDYFEQGGMFGVEIIIPENESKEE